SYKGDCFVKIVVYAICKNEAGHAERWMASMAEADGVYVLDTGSTDGTAERLRALGAVVVEERVEPWRFDTARNRSLELVPEDADICVCTDLDEVFHPGWRAALEAAWTDGTTQAVYRYTWNFNADGSEGTVFWIEKIHAGDTAGPTRFGCWSGRRARDRGGVHGGGS
ncbi:MAG: glycosyltransferase, partial [Flavonifractor plautii]